MDFIKTQSCDNKTTTKTTIIKIKISTQVFYECGVMIFSHLAWYMCQRVHYFGAIFMQTTIFTEYTAQYAYSSKLFLSKCMTFTQNIVEQLRMVQPFSNEQSSWACAEHVCVLLYVCVCVRAPQRLLFEKRDRRDSVREIKKVKSMGFNECWHLCASFFHMYIVQCTSGRHSLRLLFFICCRRILFPREQ